MASADLESLAQALKQGRVAVLTGAGCSTESGIPDYRGSQGFVEAPSHRAGDGLRDGDLA